MGTPASPVTHLDTSVLVDALTGTRRSEPGLTTLIASGEPVAIATLVLYEWLRGPRHPLELTDQESIFPTARAVAFGAEEAVLAAELYRRMPRARTREFDLGVAACALTQGAQLWTLNSRDFADIPGLRLFDPHAST
jgi:predicted nucleic acid-binding protein